MTTFNRYLVFLVLAASIINIVLALAGQKDLTVYFTVNVVAYLAITLLHAYLNPRARKSLSAVAIVLSAGFMVIVLIRVAGAISGIIGD